MQCRQRGHVPKLRLTHWVTRDESRPSVIFYFEEITTRLFCISPSLSINSRVGNLLWQIFRISLNPTSFSFAETAVYASFKNNYSVVSCALEAANKWKSRSNGSADPSQPMAKRDCLGCDWKKRLQERHELETRHSVR